MSTLLTKPMNEITYDDVIEFCDPEKGQPENQTLEYKGGDRLPSSDVIAKAASALANTFGGTLFLGVDENHKTGRPSGIPGVPADRDLENRVSSILMDNIDPPLVPLPEIQVIPFNDNPEKAVVVIGVAQSNATPHAAKDGNGNEFFYVRVHSQSRPEDWDVPASLQKLEWLFNRRRKSEELHDRLVHDALDRMELYYERGVFPHFTARGERPRGQGVFWIAPLYPEGSTTTVQELHNRCTGSTKDKEHQLVIQNRPNCTDFPSYTLMRPVSTQEAVIGFDESHAEAIRSFEFNIYGMFLYQETLACRLAPPLDETWTLDFVALCQQLDSFLELASHFYDTINPVGLLELRVEIMNLEQLCMLPPEGNIPPVIEPQHVVSYQRRIDCKRTVQANLLRDPDQRDETLLALLCEVGSAFNWDELLVRQLFKRILRKGHQASKQVS